MPDIKDFPKIEIPDTNEFTLKIKKMETSGNISPSKVKYFEFLI
jgi:hypothetical protein